MSDNYCTICGDRFGSDLPYRATCSDSCDAVFIEQGRKKMLAHLMQSLPKALEIVGCESLEEYEEKGPMCGSVYFVQSGDDGPIKIGYSMEVDQRLADLQVGAPEELHLLVKMRGNRRIENQMHERFAASRLRGEWFAPCPELLAYIAQAVAQ